jgi:hypothetical protein
MSSLQAPRSAERHACVSKNGQSPAKAGLWWGPTSALIYSRGIVGEITKRARATAMIEPSFSCAGGRLLRVRLTERALWIIRAETDHLFPRFAKP